MALLFWEGFDHYSNESDVVGSRPEIKIGWDVNGSTYGWNQDGKLFHPNVGRFGLGGTRLSYPVEEQWGFISIGSPTEVYMGRAFFSNSAGLNNGIMCLWGNHNSSAVMQKAFAPDVWLELYGNTLRVKNGNGGDWWGSVRQYGGTLLGTSDPNLMKYYTWHWIEMRVKMSTSSATNDGIVQVWLNNQLVLSNSACITRVSNTSTGYMGTNYGCCSIPGGQYDTARTDDIYVLDTTGPAPWNTRLGDLRIASVLPNADAGPNQGVPSTGNTHYGVVAEKIPVTSDYVTINNTIGYSEVFQHQVLPSVGVYSIFALAPFVCVLKSDAGSSNLSTILVSNTSGYQSNSTPIPLSTSYTRYFTPFSVNPETGVQWTPGDFANTKIGVQVV